MYEQDGRKNCASGGYEIICCHQHGCGIKGMGVVSDSTANTFQCTSSIANSIPTLLQQTNHLFVISLTVAICDNEP